MRPCFCARPRNCIRSSTRVFRNLGHGHGRSGAGSGCVRMGWGQALRQRGFLALIGLPVLLLAACAEPYDFGDSGAPPPSVSPSEPPPDEGNGDSGAPPPSVSPSEPPPDEGNGDSGAPPPSASPTALPPSATPSEPPPEGEAPPDETWSAQVREFLSDCADGIEDWRAGEVQYPGKLELEYGEATTYVATLDIRNVPDLPSREIPGPAAESVEVFVQCTIAARLSPVGDALTVDDTRWISRIFTPSGVVDWSWRVEAQEPKDGQLRLQVQPAVTSEGRIVFPPEDSPQRTDFITDVETNATWAQEMGQTFKENWAPLSAIGVALITGLIWLLTKLSVIRERLERLTKKPSKQESS
jgi:hypothetical protein